LEVQTMKTYKVVFEVVVRAENEEDAKRQAVDILNTQPVDIKVEEVRDNE